MKFTLVLAAAIIIGVTLFYLINIHSAEKLQNVVNPKGNQTRIDSFPSPTPFLFEELTIPYLRAREYKSHLGELSKYTQNSNYISYLTNYGSDGLKINGLLTEPKEEKPAAGHPAIVFIHGYISPPSYKTTSNYFEYVDYLARNGFVVFKIDLRGHGDSEGEPGGAYYSSDYIIDVLNAYSALQNSGIVNPAKIGLWGHSMAGNVVFRAMAVKSEIPAGSIWAGAVYTYKDFAEYGLSDGSYRPPSNNSERQKKRQLLMDTYGNPKDGNPFWDLVAATNYLQDFKGAIQLNHAVDDDVVNIGYSRGLNGILDKTQIPHELNEFPNGGHNITDPSFTPAMQKTVEFFKKYLN